MFVKVWQMKYPNKLFHYTSVENLALILKSNKIKFSRLDKVNDLTEAETNDFGNVGQYYFVSCWTDLEEESLPFWNMYTEKMSGVRIEFSFPILKTNKDGKIVLDSSTRQFNNTTYLFCIPKHPIEKVIYTKEKNPNFWIKNEKILSDYNLEINDEIGMHKAKIWEFESEWRYIIMIIPTKRTNTIEGIKTEYKITTPNISKKKDTVKINELYFDFNEDSFNNMTVLLGPKCSDADFIIVEALLKQYNTNTKLKWSDLKQYFVTF